MMKASQYQYAETLLKTLGAAAGTPTAARGRSEAQAVLQTWGVQPGDLIQRDGSGLSRYDYVTPDALVVMLRHIDRDARLRGPFEEALPIAGRDGTLSNRMQGTPADGNARAKTGSMANVRGLSGYVTTADGEPVAFSILANNFDVPADTITRATDAIVARADGIPLYAVETVRMLLAQGRLELADGVYRPTGDLADIAVPETLTALIASRLDGLDGADRSLIADAAVLGQSFAPAALAAVSGVEPARSEDSARRRMRASHAR